MKQVTIKTFDNLVKNFIAKIKNTVFYTALFIKFFLLNSAMKYLEIFLNVVQISLKKKKEKNFHF